MKRVLITGAAGFIGFHLARALAARGDHVVAVDNFVRGERDAALKTLADEGKLPAAKVAEAIRKYGLNADKINPLYA